MHAVVTPSSAAKVEMLISFAVSTGPSSTQMTLARDLRWEKTEKYGWGFSPRRKKGGIFSGLTKEAQLLKRFSLVTSGFRDAQCPERCSEIIHLLSQLFLTSWAVRLFSTIANLSDYSRPRKIRIREPHIQCNEP